ncbi:MAG TPA: hypothetical protein VFG90_05875 [Nitrososphaeraceae archaeon]|nr:hypothetical protein [Nitrososphaeraceae archaeon]
MYFSCVDGLNEILKECWKIYQNENNNPAINYTRKLAAIRIAGEVIEKKFGMFQNGPAIMQLDHLRDKVGEIRKLALEDNNDTFWKRSLSYKDLYPHDPNNNNESNSESDSSSGVDSDLK